MINNFLLIPAAGNGTRFDIDNPKQYFKIDGITILETTLRKAINLKIFKKILVAINPKHKDYLAIAERFPEIEFVVGGETRTDTVSKLLEKIKQEDGFAWIHDAVRPIFSDDVIKLQNELPNLKNLEGLSLGVQVVDTLAKVDDSNWIKSTIPREKTVRVFTPQIFKINEIIKMLNKNNNFTDESSLFLNGGGSVKLIEGNPHNLKITFKNDVYLD